MSSNNTVIITKRENKYVVEDIDVDTGIGYAIASEETFEDAIKSANEYMEENIVEYGLEIKL